MSKHAVYQFARSLVRRVPPGLASLRPISIYQISLAAESSALSVAQNPAAGQTTARPVNCRWVVREDLDGALVDLSSTEHLRSWNGGMVRAAVAICPSGVPVGVVWLHRRRFSETTLGWDVLLAPHDVWLSAAHVAAAQRRTGIYRLLLHFVADQLQGEGMARILLGIVPGNIASSKAHQQFGAEKVGSIFAVRCLGCLQAVLRTGDRIRYQSRPVAWGRHTVELRIQ